MIKFSDFMPVDFPDKTKVKFNMNAGNTALRAWDYLLDDAPEWVAMNAHKRKQANNNLNHADYLLAFAQYYGYKLTLLPDYADYRKRLIIRLKKPIGRDIYNKPYQSVQRDFDPEVYELAPATKLGAFPGYSKVLLSHKDLQTIIKLDAPEWKNALSSVKGVYCITDRSTGQLYIGSATGDIAGIWQRWSSYADVTNLTGGNKAFEELKNNGADYIVENFSYSILEIFDMRTKREDIIQRESYWKRVFQTIKYGMNNN